MEEQTSTIRILWDIFFTMFKIGLVTFGGGYAMLPIIEQEFIHKKGWIDEKEMLDITVLAESLPGAIAVDAVVMLGYRVKKIKGAVAAAIGVVLPSFIILSIVTVAYTSIDEKSMIWLFVKGIRAGVIGLMCSVVIKLFRSAVTDWVSGILFAAAFVVALTTDIHLVLIVLAGGIIGLCLGRWRRA